VQAFEGFVTDSTDVDELVDVPKGPGDNDAPGVGEAGSGEVFEFRRRGGVEKQGLESRTGSCLANDPRGSRSKARGSFASPCRSKIR